MPGSIAIQVLPLVQGNSAPRRPSTYGSGAGPKPPEPQRRHSTTGVLAMPHRPTEVQPPAALAMPMGQDARALARPPLRVIPRPGPSTHTWPSAPLLAGALHEARQARPLSSVLQGDNSDKHQTYWAVLFDFPCCAVVYYSHLAA